MEDLRACWTHQPFRAVPAAHCGCHENIELTAQMRVMFWQALVAEDLNALCELCRKEGLVSI